VESGTPPGTVLEVAKEGGPVAAVFRYGPAVVSVQDGRLGGDLAWAQQLA
jgi:hypothetical protein